jgi:hypothetical protein
VDIINLGWLTSSFCIPALSLPFNRERARNPSETADRKRKNSQVERSDLKVKVQDGDKN